MKVILIIFSLFFICNVFAQVIEEPVAGDGSPESPYQVSTTGNILWIYSLPENLSKHYIQINDINAAETMNWYNGTGWPNSNETFSGSYDGNNYSIDSLYMNNTDFQNAKGLFSIIHNATIKNLSLSDLSLTSNSYTTGGICGAAGLSTIQNCTVSGNIRNVYFNGDTGGICGITQLSSITECLNYATVTGNVFTGGISGESYGTSTFKNCINYGSIVTENDHYQSCSGGILGQTMTSVTIDQCANYGTITNGQSTGGIAGFLDSSNLFDEANIQVSSCYNYGHIIGKFEVGGLIGYASYYDDDLNPYSKIINCYSRADVTCVTDSNKVGLFIGRGGIPVDNCYATGSVYYNNGINPTDKGFIGFIEENQNDDMQNNYFDMESSNQNSGYGATGKTTLEMMNQNTYINWDFNNIWTFYPFLNDAYPSLINNNQLNCWISINNLINNSVDIVLNMNTLENVDSFGLTINIEWPLYNENPYLEILINPEEFDGHYTHHIDNLLINKKYSVAGFFMINGIRYTSNKKYFDTFVYQPEAPTGFGSVSDPFLITSVNNLLWMASDTLHVHPCYKQINDIVFNIENSILSEILKPIGSEERPFQGNYDGQNYSIKNLFYQNPESDYIALFAFVKNSIIENLIIENANVHGNNYSGIIAGKVENSNIINCTIKNSILQGNDYLGGFAGYVYQGLSNNIVIDNLNIIGNDFLGGFTGYIYNGSLNNLTVDSLGITGNNYLGGFTGYANQGSLINITVDSLRITGNDYLGGITGYVNQGSLNNITVDRLRITGHDYLGGFSGCLYTYDPYKKEDRGLFEKATIRNIDIEGHNYLGGFAGKIHLYDIKYVSTTGIIKGNNYLGGFAGNVLGYVEPSYQYFYKDVKYCYSHVDVYSSPGNNYYAGFVGGTKLINFYQCYSIGKALCTDGSNSGTRGFTRDVYYEQHSSGTDCYFDTERSMQTTGIYALGRTTEQMHEPGNYNNWPFNSIWYVDPDYNEGYPYFMWQYPVGTSDPNPEILQSNLNHPYPNPCNPNTNISFTLKIADFTNVSIYNIKGQKVKNLINEKLKAGKHELIWDGKDSYANECASGIYFIRMKAGNYSSVKKVTVIK